MLQEEITVSQYRNAIVTAEYFAQKAREAEHEVEKKSNLSKAIRKGFRRASFPIRFIKNKSLLRKLKKTNFAGLNRNEKREKRIIVSLTSYPGRIKIVPYTIFSLLNQTVKPDLIILWLGKEKFPGEMLPPIFEIIKKYGVRVEFRKDYKSHTKYLYAIQEYPDDIIITVDDDLIYESTLIERLYNSYLKNPYDVSAMRVHKMRFDNQNKPLDYKEWIYEYNGIPGSKSHRYFATGVGGVLYPPKALYKDVTNTEIFEKLCHNHDDFWLKIMEVLNDTKVVIANRNISEKPIPIIGSQKNGQWRENVINGGNDRQAKAVLKYYSQRAVKGKSICEMIAEDI